MAPGFNAFLRQTCSRNIVFSRETVRRLQRLIYLAIETGFILVLGIAAVALVQRSTGHDYEGESRKETPDSSS